MTEERRSAGPRRSKMEVKIDIMQAIAEGAGRPTHIMYRSNLSWAVMRNFMKLLETQGLVVVDKVSGRKTYVLTEKGQRVLQTYTNVKSQLDQLAPLIAVGGELEDPE
jgi:predicted transcriptional regulator